MVWRLLIWALIVYLAYKVIKNIVGYITGPKESRSHTYGERRDQKRYGETTINRSQSQSRRPDDDEEGEYIDYKEIKD